MRRFFTLALLVAPLATLSVQAQPYLPPPPPGYGQNDGVALVTGWVRQYLGRKPNRQDIANGQAIDAGALDPNDLLPGILSCDEYYIKRAGRDDYRFVQTVYRDVIGRAPSQRETDYWYRRLQDGPGGMDGRTEVVSDLLQSAAHSPQPTAPPYRDRP